MASVSTPKVAYGGVHPSVDISGKVLTGSRMSQAGTKLAGGPYALTSIRLWLGEKNPQLSNKSTMYIYIYICMYIDPRQANAIYYMFLQKFHVPKTCLPVQGWLEMAERIVAPQKVVAD